MATANLTMTTPTDGRSRRSKSPGAVCLPPYAAVQGRSSWVERPLPVSSEPHNGADRGEAGGLGAPRQLREEGRQAKP